MKKTVNIEVMYLVLFLEYLEDKTEECYKKEVKQAIKRFLKRCGVNEL